jgi:hypothetical protein
MADHEAIHWMFPDWACRFGTFRHPRKHGTLHLLLYVTPMLYVDGIGEQLKQFKQPPRLITVTPDYWYECTTFLNDHWAVLSTLLTAILIPLFLWFLKGIMPGSKNALPRKIP